LYVFVSFVFSPFAMSLNILIYSLIY